MELLDFFDSEETLVKQDLRLLKKEVSSLRKGLFARLSALKKEHETLKYDYETLKKSIAKNDEKLWQEIRPKEKDYDLW